MRPPSPTKPTSPSKASSGSSPAGIALEALAGHPDFLPLNSLAGVAVDLRYASTNNFAKRNLYGGFNCAFLRKEAGLALVMAASHLHASRPGWRLVVLDALRPQRVQEAIWKDVVGTPAQAYFANPVAGSIHTYGMAVDVSLLSPEGQVGERALMGGDFDQMDEISHPRLHAKLLAAGKISAAQVAQREVLRRAMVAGGFRGIGHEWWHFDFGRPAWVRQNLPRVL